MMYKLPTISKAQYDLLLKLSEEKKYDFSIDRKQYGIGDSLNTFLKEHSSNENNITETKIELFN